MKVLFILLMIFIGSCGNREYSSSYCKEKSKVIKDTIFDDSDILAGFSYNIDCKINELNLITKIDERSSLENMGQLLDIALKYGHLGDTLLTKVISSKDSSVSFNEKQKLLYLNLEFEEPFLESINLIELKTIANNHSDGKRISKSESYFYDNSLSLLGMENTYLDYRAFSRSDVAIVQNNGTDGNTIETLLLTVKIENQNIDEIYDIAITINDNLRLNFKSSILASFEDFERSSGEFELLNMVKRSNEHLELNIGLGKSDLQDVNKIVVHLNGKKYQ